MGTDVVIYAVRHPDPVAAYERQRGCKPTEIFECVGRPMIAMAPSNAHLVLVGARVRPENFMVMSAALKRLWMTFLLTYETGDFPFVLRMLAAGRVTATVSLDETQAMFEVLGRPNNHCKVLITP